MTERRTVSQPLPPQTDEPARTPTSTPPPEVPSQVPQRSGPSGWQDYADWHFAEDAPPEWRELFPDLLWSPVNEEWTEWDPLAGPTSIREYPNADRDEELRRLGIDPLTGQPYGFDPTDGGKYSVKPPERPEQEPPVVSPPDRSGGARRKKRARVGAAPFWMSIWDNLKNGNNPLTGLPWNINPMTGQPWGFDVNRGADGRRYSFGLQSDLVEAGG